MSARAIRALRGDDAGMIPAIAAVSSNGEDDGDDDDDPAETTRGSTAKRGRTGGFAAAMMMMDDSSSSSGSSGSDGDNDNDGDEDEEEGEGEENDEKNGDEKGENAFFSNENTTTARSTDNDGRKSRSTTHRDDDDNEDNEKAKKEEEAEEEEEEEEEDLDALLCEFIKNGDVEDSDDGNKKKPPPQSSLSASSTGDVNKDSNKNNDNSNDSSFCSLLLRDLDARDMDMDHSMRTSLRNNNGGSGGSDRASSASASAAAENNHDRRRKTTNKKKNAAGGGPAFLFGPHRDGWIRPPHRVGGGMGMMAYGDNDAASDSRQRQRRRIPWPYNDPSIVTTASSTRDGWNDPDCWYTFVASSDNDRDRDDYWHVQHSGNLNALLLFVAHHPYAVDALLQVVTVMYQTNRSHEGQAFLRRCLWIFECASLRKYTRQIVGGGGGGTGGFVRIDADEEPENEAYFRALHCMVRVSSMAGLPRTALALSRLILSLDPLRDPKSILLAMDHFALSTNQVHVDEWLVNLVEQQEQGEDAIPVLWYRDDDSDNVVYKGTLLDLPNWAYSYALACFRLSSTGDANDFSANKADRALENAIRKFPGVVGLLLQATEVDTTGRSFRRDWPSVLDYATEYANRLHRSWHASTDTDPVVLSATLQSCERVVDIFVQQNAKLWGTDQDVLQWLHDTLQRLKEEKSSDANTDSTPVAAAEGIQLLPGPPNPVLMRYMDCNPSDFVWNRFETTLPEEVANMVDPGLVAHAMVVDPRRGRFLRGNNNNNNRRNNQDGDDDDMGERLLAHLQGEQQQQREQQRGRPMLGGPPVQVINPDWPLVEVFWRSFLPWNRVEGVRPPPPRRRMDG